MAKTTLDPDALIAEFTRRRPCKVAGAGKADLVNALTERRASAHMIARILTEKCGLPIVYNTVQRHQRRECGCK